MTFRHLRFVLFLLSTCPLLLAQDSKPKPCEPAAKSEDCLSVDRADLQLWVPEYKARVARAFQYQLGLQEQPGSVTIQNGSAAEIIPNPEHYLVKHSLSFQFSELFVTSSDFASAVKAFSDTNPKKALYLQNCRRESLLACIATPGPSWERALSGVKIAFSLSERSRVLSGIVVPAGPFPTDYDKSGEVDFDPMPIFNVGSNWKTAAAALADLTNRGPTRAAHDCFELSPKEQYVPPRDTETCVKLYGGFKNGSSGKKEALLGFLAVALPNFKYARQTQFDFLKNGGVLTPSPFPEPALNSYTFIWDLRHLIAPTKERAAVIDAMKTYNTIKKDPADHATGGTKLCVTISNGQKNYMPISDSFPESACQRFAQAISEGHFAFACVATTGEVTFGKEGKKPASSACSWAEPSKGDLEATNLSQ